MLLHGARTRSGRIRARVADEHRRLPRGRLVEFVRLIFVVLFAVAGYSIGTQGRPSLDVSHPPRHRPRLRDRIRPRWRPRTADGDRGPDDRGGHPAGPGRRGRRGNGRDADGPRRGGAALDPGVPSPAARRVDDRGVHVRDARVRGVPGRPDQERRAVRPDRPEAARRRRRPRRGERHRHERPDRRACHRPGLDRIPLRRPADPYGRAPRAAGDRRHVRPEAPSARTARTRHAG